jgi:SAM-dependent methyltransferase
MRDYGTKRRPLVEFTGERLIPGQVTDDLFHEHMARYVFAARMAGGKRVLDAGCGAGYGSAELAHVATSVIGADGAADAIAFARENYRLPNLHFEEASCEALPHRDGSFDLVVAFEVIEHLERWSEFLLEVRRVLAPQGQFVVSTPNKSYYTESRGQEGRNPFHVHEFDFEEFRSELLSVFPEVALFLENHVEGIAFQPYDPATGVEVHVDSGKPVATEAHFFVAVCGHREFPTAPFYLYVPRAGNVLRERGRHITLLEEELATKNAWLERALREHEELLAAHRQQKEELERSNRWAADVNREANERGARVVELQDELAQQQRGYQAKVAELEEDISAKVEWAQDLERKVGVAVEVLHRTEKELEDRTAWALRLEQEKQQLEQQLAFVRASRWMKVGRKIGLGPELPD